MMKTFIDQFVAAHLAKVDAFADAVQMAAPVIVIGALVWYGAKAGQWLIDRYTLPRRGGMRTADAARVRRDVEDLLWRGSQGFENTYPLDEPPRPRKRAGAPPANPFPQPDLERRRP